jgi:S-adenosylmethionine-diacylgycerolhomoserine-N-methlytransferase
MIPDWQAALEQAAACVAPGGRLEVVDFGQQDRLPGLWRRALFGWLHAFHVTPRPDLPRAIETLAARIGAMAHARTIYRGYAVRSGLIRV